MDRDPSYAELVPSLDEWHHAHNAMLRAVDRDGPRVLSEPKRIASYLDDELAGLPRERMLLVRAVELQVPGIIKGMVNRCGVDRAVELAGATLFALHGRDPDGCLWVAAEMARVMGHRPADYVSLAEWIGQPGGYLDFAEPSAEPVAELGNERGDASADGVRDGTGNVSLFESRPEHLPRANEAAPSHRVHRDGEVGGYDPEPTYPGYGEYERRFKPRQGLRRWLRPKTVGGIAASLVLIYFALAGVFLLPPYSRKSGTTSASNANNAAVTNQKNLLKHIPPAIRTNCQASAYQNPDIVASVICQVNISPVIRVVYDQFGNSGSAAGAFNTDVHPGTQPWGPTGDLPSTSSCDPNQNANFVGTGSYQRDATGSDATMDSGSIACWVSSTQEPTIDWTSADQTIDANAVVVEPAGSATPSQADKESLFGFWSGQAGPQ
ncbi:MAG: hypothetical protein ACRDJU_13855 [Actinomycetota bacterium]